VFNALCCRLADISVTPDYTGLPTNLYTGLTHLTNNAAAVMFTVSALGIVLSITGLIVGHVLHKQYISEKSWAGLGVSAGAGAILYLGVHFANYAAGLFR
jgi:hypothetical protein